MVHESSWEFIWTQVQWNGINCILIRLRKFWFPQRPPNAFDHNFIKRKMFKSKYFLLNRLMITVAMNSMQKHTQSQPSRHEIFSN
jgi:hypothetical protein